VQKAEASQARVNEFLATEPEISPFDRLRDRPFDRLRDLPFDKIENDAESTNIEGVIEFKNVNFTYPDSGVEALHNVSFTIQKGERVAIIGKTGSGKSTIAQLMLRMFDPNTGSISIDGLDIKKQNLYSLRKAIGYVPQDVFLFSDTINSNIGFGLENQDEEIIKQAAKDADVYHNIIDFPKQFETLLGERGINISGGQKQRISIARAIAKNPNILLFDDCLSAVDTETEEHILSALDRIMENKTSIIISHRISSLKNATRILVLDKGSIIEQGSHDELMKLDGLYASMYRRQSINEKEL
jgi:ATP-binding cassette subfamily B protein